MVKYNSSNFTLIISQLIWPLKKEPFLIIKVFHLPSLSQCFTTWTMACFVQFTTPSCHVFSAVIPPSHKCPGTTCSVVTVAFLPSTGFIIVQWKWKAMQLIEEFLALLNISLFLLWFVCWRSINSYTVTPPRDWHWPHGVIEASLLWKGRIRSGYLFSAFVRFFRFLSN